MEINHIGTEEIKTERLLLRRFNENEKSRRQNNKR